MTGMYEYTVNTNKLCHYCANTDDCGGVCNATIKLLNTIKSIDYDNKIELLSKMKEQVITEYSEESKIYKELGNKIINRFERFELITDLEIQIGYVVSYEQKKNKNKLVYGQCEKVSKEQKAFLPYDFIITIYEPNAELLSPNQIKILMKHELIHIDYGKNGLKIRDHDINDFVSIISEHGYNWNDWIEGDVEVVDILGGEDNE